MSAKVSAIVSAYYAEEYLRGRLTNLMAGSLVPEIIVVCQADSPEHLITEEYQKHIATVITRDVPTIYEAWNIGIAKSSGQYITNANSDDRFEPTAIERMAKVLDKYKGIGVAYGNVDIIEKIDGEPVGQYNWREGGYSELINEGCFLSPMPMWRSVLHDKHGYFDESFRVAGDYEFWLRIAKAGTKFMKLDKPVGRYLKRPDSAEHREPVRTIHETARARAMHRK
jgi:glycosyltransferase involved in cell wall biosynthesis